MKTEQTVKIGGKDYTLAFNFKAVMLAEEDAGQSIFQLVSGEISMRQLAVLFWAVLQEKHQVPHEEVPDLVDQAGVPAVMGWVSKGLGDLLTNKRRPKKAA